MDYFPGIITGFYASLLGLFYIFLTRDVIRNRARHKVYLYDGGVEELQRSIRAHANFGEYVPFTLLLILLVELQDVHYMIVHVLCLVLISARLSHAYSLVFKERSRTKKGDVNFMYRAIGVNITLSVIFAACIILAYSYLRFI